MKNLIWLTVSNSCWTLGDVHSMTFSSTMQCRLVWMERQVALQAARDAHTLPSPVKPALHTHCAAANCWLLTLATHMALGSHLILSHGSILVHTEPSPRKPVLHTHLNTSLTTSHTALRSHRTPLQLVRDWLQMSPSPSNPALHMHWGSSESPTVPQWALGLHMTPPHVIIQLIPSPT